MRTGQLEHNCSLDDILAHLSETSFSAIPDDAAERTALITADIAACIVGGWRIGRPEKRETSLSKMEERKKAPCGDAEKKSPQRRPPLRAR